MKVPALLFLLIVTGSAPVGFGQDTLRTQVKNRIAIKAYPFPLQDVRLLSGPFHDAMMRDQKYLLELDPDRLLHMFRVTAGLPSSARPLGGWEAPDIELRGHSMGHFLSACALMYSSTGDKRFKAKADAIVGELAKIQRALPSKGFNPGYLAAFPEELFDRADRAARVWAPYYTLHKIMAGLLDVYIYNDNPLALEVVVKMADWVKFRVDRLTDEQQQRTLNIEFGGMNEVMANLYAVTGNAEYLRVGRKFDHRAVLDPLSRGEDKLNGLHANTQIPKAIGAAREYELTGEKRYYDIATFFWQRVALNRSYVIGGHSDGESFFPVDQFSKHLGATSTETCNTYNMLKLSRHLFAWEPSGPMMDFYERGLYNHILASQDPATGMVCYYVPLKPGAFKTFSTADESFWCCVGTGMENHAKYPDTIYFHDDQSLYVNLFIASELNWREKKLSVRQETRFPEEDRTRLTLMCEKPVRLAVKIRYPGWIRETASNGLMLTINGKTAAVDGAPGSYVKIEREWKNGDTIEIRLPMSLRLEPLPGDPTTVAVLYGPIVLAGDLGKEGMETAKRYGPTAPQLGRVSTLQVPAFVCDVKEVLPRLRLVSGSPMNFQTAGIGQPRDVLLSPFYKMAEQRYTVYWKVYSPAGWEKKKGEIAAAESRRQEIERRTLDAVAPGDPDSERDHGFKGEGVTGNFEGRTWRGARNGSFSYELKVMPDKPLILVCTYRGSEGLRRAFDIFVDGEKVASQALEIHPTELFDIEYPLPVSVTQGKQRITVTFKAHPEAIAGSVFDVRVVQ